MRKYLLLTRYHLNKNRGQYISFAIITLVAAAIFELGLIVSFKFGKMFDQKFEHYQCAEVYYTIYESDWFEELPKMAEELDHVEKVEVRKNLYLAGKATYADSENTINHVFFNLSEPHTMNTLETIGDTLPMKGLKNPIYISYWVKANGAKIGDTYTFTSGNNVYEFTIAGFVEDLMYGNNNCVNLAIYIADEDFQRLYQEADPNLQARTISLGVDNKSNSKSVFYRLTESLSGRFSRSYDNNCGYYDMAYRNRTSVAAVVSIVIIAFSILLVLITVLVVNFRIKSGIEEEMQNMGVMKSLGYKGRQIIRSVAIPYCFLGIVAIFLGVLCAYLVMPFVQGIMEKLAGLCWKQTFDWAITSIVTATLFIMISFTTLIAARRIKKLHVLDALRSGIKHHNFKKNYFSFHKSVGSFNFIMGMKGFAASLKHNVFLFFIIAVLSFSVIYMESGLYCTSVAPERFINLLSEESPNVMLNFDTNENAQKAYAELEKDDAVRKVLYYAYVKCLIEGEDVSLYVVDKNEELENELCYKGRHPKHDNEVLIGTRIAETKNLNIGDSIKLTNGKQTEEYIVVGFMQSPNNNGIACELTSSGYKRIEPNFTWVSMNIYLEDSDYSAEFTQKAIDTYGKELTTYMDYQSTVDMIYENFIPLSSMIIGMIAVVVALLVIAVVYMVVKTLVFQKKQELGICKAVGYTTHQLVVQMAYSLVPSMILGTLTGGILGTLFVNKVWLLAFHGIGIRKCDLSVPLVWAIVGIAVMLLYTTMVALLLSRRVKKITAIALIRE